MLIILLLCLITILLGTLTAVTYMLSGLGQVMTGVLLGLSGKSSFTPTRPWFAYVLSVLTLASFVFTLYQVFQ